MRSIRNGHAWQVSTVTLLITMAVSSFLPLWADSAPITDEGIAAPSKQVDEGNPLTIIHALPGKIKVDTELRIKYGYSVYEVQPIGIEHKGTFQISDHTLSVHGIGLFTSSWSNPHAMGQKIIKRP